MQAFAFTVLLTSLLLKRHDYGSTTLLKCIPLWEPLYVTTTAIVNITPWLSRDFHSCGYWHTTPMDVYLVVPGKLKEVNEKS